MENRWLSEGLCRPVWGIYQCFASHFSSKVKSTDRIEHPTAVNSQPGPSGVSSYAEPPFIVISSDSSDTDAVSLPKAVYTPSADNMDMLCELFSHATSTQIDLAMMLCDGNVQRVCQLFLEELTAQPLLKHLRRKRMLDTYRHVSINPEAFLSDALAKV